MNEKKMISQFVKKYRENPYNKCTTIESILEKAIITKYEKNDYLYHDKDKSEACYYILSGSVEIFKINDNYNKRVYSILRTGDSFGIPELFEGEHVVNAQCLKDSLIAILSKENFFKYAMKNELYNYDIMKMMASVLAVCQRALSISKAENKLCSYLYYIAKNSLISDNNIIKVNNNKKYEEIGNILGLARETVARILSKLKKQKIIKIDQDYFYILDIDKLKMLAYSDDYMIGYYGSE